MQNSQSLHFLTLNYNKSPEYDLSHTNSAKNITTCRSSLRINKSFATKNRLFTASKSKMNSDQTSEIVFSNKNRSSIPEVLSSPKNNFSLSFIRNSSVLNLRVLGTGISPEVFEYKAPVAVPKLSRMARRANIKKTQAVVRVKKINSERKNLKKSVKIPGRFALRIGLKDNYSQVSQWEIEQ